jgi:hypothetical protein
VKVVNTNDFDSWSVLMLDFTGEKSIDLRPNIVEFSVYEDILAQNIKATITYNDAHGLIDTFPIIGEEVVRIAFKSASFEEDDRTKQEAVFLFSLYKITGRSRLNERNEVYTLHLVSMEDIVNAKTESNNGYVGKTIDDIVKSEFTNHITSNKFKWGIAENVFLLDPAGIEVEATAGLHAFVSPSTTCFQFINYLATQARSSVYAESDYIFYRDQAGFKFKPISTLFAGDVYESYFYADPQAPNVEALSVEGKDVVQRHQILYDVSYKEMPDTYMRMQNGMYENKTRTLDLLTKQFKTKVFRYQEAGPRKPPGPQSKVETFHNLSRNLLTSDFSVHQNKAHMLHNRMFLVDSDQKVIDYMKFKEHDNNIRFPKTRQDFIGKRISKINQVMNTNRLTVTISGDQEITVGKIVNIFLPLNATTPTLQQRYNLLFGNDEEAKFMVTAVVHHYDNIKGEYTTRLEIIKDSYGNRIEFVQEFLNKDVFSWGN